MRMRKNFFLISVGFAIMSWMGTPVKAQEPLGNAEFSQDSRAQKVADLMNALAQESGLSPAPAGEKKTAPVAPPAMHPQQEISDQIMIDVLELKSMDIADVLKLISQKSGLNVVAGSNVSGKVTIYLKDIKLKDVLRIILDANNLAYQYENGVVQVMPAVDFEMRYGYKFGGNIKTKVLRVLHADVLELSVLLNQIKSPSGKIIADPKTSTIVLMDSADQLKTMAGLVKDMDFPLESQVFELTYAPIKDIAPKLDEALTRNVGSYRFDERSNKIVVTDTPAKIKQITKILEAFDVKRREVLIEAKIIQVVLSDQYKYGVDWEAVEGSMHAPDIKSSFKILSATDKVGKITVGTLANTNYTALIEALETVGDTKILSSPRISALNNEEAKIMVGSSEPYVTTTTTTAASGPATTAESVNFIDVGVKLYVTPTIHKDNFITMKIKPEVSAVTTSLPTSSNNSIPIKESSEAETTVMVKDGATIVIGGLIKDENLDTINKVPLLGDIPFIGGAFRNKNQKKTKTEIMIFLTPKIITGEMTEEDERALAIGSFSRGLKPGRK